jgi:hypothetical protein
LIRFGLLALVLTLLVGGLWSALLVANLAISPAIPWSVVVMAALLWLMWQYLGGWWGPRHEAPLKCGTVTCGPGE